MAEKRFLEVPATLSALSTVRMVLGGRARSYFRPRIWTPWSS